MKLSDDNHDQSIDEDPWKKPFKIQKTKNGKRLVSSEVDG